MKKHLFLLITAIIALSMIFTACLGGEDNPPKTDKPEPPAHDGVFVCGESSMTFNGDGKSIKLSIDPDTAAPANSGLAGVTVVSDSALLCDGLSTALFVMGLEQAADHWREYRDFEAIFMEDSGKITITAGLKDSFSLTDGYKDREVTVLE